MLAWMRPVEPPKNRTTIEPALFGEVDNWLFLRLVRQAQAATQLSVRAVFSERSEVASKPVQTAIYIKTARGDPHEGPTKKLTVVARGKNSAAPAPNLPVIAYGANRQIGVQNLGDPVLTDPVAMLFAAVTTLYDPESILRDLDYAMRMDKAGAALRRQQFLALIATIAPQIGNVENIEFSGPSIDADGADLTGIKFRNAFGLVSFAEMSLGQQTTIAWAIDLAWRLVRLYPNSPTPMSEPAIVLVDEIDLHLHPRWQQSLRTYLSEHFPATQFIATAHSPLMAQASLDANLVVFQEKGGIVTVWNDAERLLDWRLDQVVTALFGLPSARAPEIQILFDERDKLLDTRRRTPDQEARLVELKGRIAGLSAPDVVADQAAMDIIRRAAIRIGQSAT
ncbi:AAA family ATPase [uncultured Enterovirga sp.]|uniref:AAA family ATPase n=1 Tax=uncultured Enterovirga sp. TaxID=2026352 RepID=UPI0035CB7A0B